MKVVAIFGLAVLALGSALPTEVNDAAPQAKFVDGIVAGIIEGLAQQLKEGGYDPYTYSDEYDFALPRADVLSVAAVLDQFMVIGISDIVINQMNYGLLSFRLTFDVSLPEITVVIGHAGLKGTVLSYDFQSDIAGQITLREIGVRGSATVTILSGIGLSSLDVNVYLQGIESKLVALNAFGMNYAPVINNFLNNKLYNALLSNQDGINEVVNEIAWQVVQEIL